jgi:hypothetical protein
LNVQLVAADGERDFGRLGSAEHWSGTVPKTKCRGKTGDAFLDFILTATADSKLRRGRIDCKTESPTIGAPAVSAAYSRSQGGNASSRISAIRFCHIQFLESDPAPA